MIGIHNSPGSFSDRWIELCRRRSIPFCCIDCTSTDIMRQTAGLDAVLWHWTLHQTAEQLLARQVIAALEAKGLLVFPNSASCWHYDDKVGQKFLLEGINAPLVPTWVFTNREEARAWIEAATWPKVFKLRCGASSDNVRLVRSLSEARAVLRQAYGKGFPAQPGYLHDARTRLGNTRGLRHAIGKLNRAPSSLASLLELRRQLPRQRGYVYFQEFLPGNQFDTRITVIGSRAFAFLRQNRPGDFRASGSGRPVFDPTKVDLACVRTAFEVARKLGTQSLAFDFIFDEAHQPKIVEISYCYVASLVRDCEGYWDEALEWHPGHVWPQDAILDDIVALLADRSQSGVLLSQ